ncbi:MAG: alpha-L-fucosidase [Bacteroidales bacterium]|nr:alpha-L-fucosidase [Bacteroidales bacterium]
MKRFFLAVTAIAFVFSSCGCGKTDNSGVTPGGTTEEGIAVTGVSLEKNELEMFVGETVKLAATIIPADAEDDILWWSSDDESVATVGEETGLVTAVAPGLANITVTTDDGDFTDVCEITVKEKTLPPANAPKAYGAVPTEGQVAWQRQELLMFYHYGQATFSGWDGENSSCNGQSWSESLLLRNYNPGTIDTDQWVKVAAENDFKEVIITAKHHDGFCLWDNPESTTDVANANCSNHTDVIAGLREACNKYDVNLGIYLSPWDRMIEVSGVSTSVYETRFKNAAKDLMTKYAPVVEFWLDGNHAGNFNWTSVNNTILGINPQCVIFSNGGPGCRWVGNENGDAAETNWATLNIKGRGLSPSNLPGSYESYLGGGDRGGDSWCPAECDFSIQQIGDRNGWFYGRNDSRKTAKQLMDLYYKSVGRNGVFLMNVPPSDQGIIDSAEENIIKEFTQMRRSVFATNLADGATVTSEDERGAGFEAGNILDPDYDRYFATPDGKTTTEFVVELSGTKRFNRVMLQEYIPLGQRVTGFTVEYRSGGSWRTWKSGTTIGHKRILLGDRVSTDAVRVKITGSLACPVINGFGLYNDTVTGL